MSETLSHQFIATVEPIRDRLFALALGAEGTQLKAESLLHKSAREAFARFAQSPQMDVAGALEKALGTTSAADAPMPADVWARLAAAIQVEAAGLAHSKALNPDSVLLSPDPLLAPKKAGGGAATEGLDLPGPSRFLIGSVVVIVIGVLLTIYIVTRPGGGARAHPSTRPATMPAGRGGGQTDDP